LRRRRRKGLWMMFFDLGVIISSWITCHRFRLSIVLYLE
jgi:hypothetical protein